MQSDWDISYLNKVLRETGLKPTSLAKLVGVAATTLTRALYDPDHKFRLSTTTLDKIKDATGISYSEIAAEHEPAPSAPSDDAALIPIYDVEASAGHGSEVSGETILCNLAFDRSFLRKMTVAKPDQLSIIRVKGHSMEPTLLDDDHVLVDRTKTNLSYDGLFVLRFDDALHVKRIGRSAQSGNVIVISDHPAYRDLDMPKMDLNVIGRVLWVGRKV